MLAGEELLVVGVHIDSEAALPAAVGTHQLLLRPRGEARRGSPAVVVVAAGHVGRRGPPLCGGGRAGARRLLLHWSGTSTAWARHHAHQVDG